MLYDYYKDALYPGTSDVEDFSKERVLRLLRALRGEPVSDFEGVVGIEQFTNRIQPHSPGLAERVWYGGGMASATWAGEQGINYLTSSVVSIDGTESRDFATIQGQNIDAYRAAIAAHHPTPRKGQGVTGFGGHPDRFGDRRPDPPVPGVRRESVRAHQSPAGSARHVVLPRLRRHVRRVGRPAVHAHAGFQRADEVAFALPFTFEADDYQQIITDLAERLGPTLGWTAADGDTADGD
jgi:hypothetical protein